MGNLGKDPEVKNLESGQVLTKFPLATSRKFKNKEGELVEETTWHNVIVWGKQAENCGKFLKKGSPALLEGEIRVRSYDQDGVKKYMNEIVANNVKFLWAGGREGAGNGSGGGVGPEGDDGFDFEA